MSPRCRSPAAAAGAGHCTHTRGDVTVGHTHACTQLPGHLTHTVATLSLCKWSHAYSCYPRQFLHCRHEHLPPTSPLQLLAFRPAATHIHTRQRHRESPDNWYQKPSFAQGQPLLSFYDSSCHLFLNSFLCKWSWAFPFLSFIFSTKHWILNLTLSPNALPLHLIVHPISIANNLLQS